MQSGKKGASGDEDLQGLSIVVGMGASGLSCARFLASLGAEFALVDSRERPPLLKEFMRLFPNAKIELGGFSPSTLAVAQRLIVSPGISLSTPAIAERIANGMEVLGDIALFARRVSAPIIAVTGSNGKSTVVALLAAILRAEGRSFGLGGNLDGENFKPALDLLLEQDYGLYILELSSFQLETTDALGAAAVALLNLSEDHMDRYVDKTAYLAAKQKIFNGAQCAVINADDPLTQPPAAVQAQLRYKPSGLLSDGFGVGRDKVTGRRSLCWRETPFLSVDDMRLVGEHNVANSLAAAGLAMTVGVSLEAIASGIREFPGLAHRCQWVAKLAGVDFYNDSKGTNVGAALASIEGIGSRLAADDDAAKLHLIAGGEGKGADFSPLAPALAQYARSIVLIGKDAPRIAEAIETGCGDCEMLFAQDMQEAVTLARDKAQEGDAVLLSPACASFDMFDNFQHRGECFASCVRDLGVGD